MTNKQLLKRLQYQQNRLLDIKGYSFYLTSSNNKDIGIYFTVWIHDGYKNNEVIFTNNFDIEDYLLSSKLCKLKDIVNELLNKEKTRN